MTSCDALQKLTTVSEIPAPVSIMSASTALPSSLKAFINPVCSAGVRFAILFMPEDAGIIFIFDGPSTIISSSDLSPLTTCERSYSVFKPNKTSTFAMPKSASSNNTSFFCLAMDMAKLTDILVLPTPPLPLLIAIVFNGLGSTIRRKLSA